MARVGGGDKPPPPRSVWEPNSIVTGAPHLALAPHTSRLAPRLPHGSHPSRHRTCSLVLWLEGAPAPLLLASRLATPLPSDLLSRPLARVACLTARNLLAIGLALSSFGARAHLHLFCLPHGSQPPCHRTCSLVLWLGSLASRLATLSPSDLLSRPLARGRTCTSSACRTLSHHVRVIRVLLLMGSRPPGGCRHGRP